MHILFDFDGTIAQSFDVAVEIYNQLAPKYHLQTIEAEMIADLQTKGARELFALSGLSPFQLPFFIRDARAALAEKISTVAVVPNLPAVLTQLTQRGHTLGIVTSNTKSQVKTFLTLHNLLPLFAFIHDEKNLWGKGAALQKVLQQYQLTADQTIYVGDESRDIEAARKAGVKVVVVTWGFNSKVALEKAQPDFLIHHPEELLEIDFN